MSTAFDLIQSEASVIAERIEEQVWVGVENANLQAVYKALFPDDELSADDPLAPRIWRMIKRIIAAEVYHQLAANLAP